MHGQKNRRFPYIVLTIYIGMGRLLPEARLVENKALDYTIIKNRSACWKVNAYSDR